MDKHRSVLRSGFEEYQRARQDPALEERIRSDQSKGVPPPPVQLPHDPAATVLDLPRPDGTLLVKSDIDACLHERRSRRRFSKKPLALAELAYLLWATQGIDELIDDYASLRPAPSGGARHPLETYLIVNRVEGLEPAVYRYLPKTHQLLFVFDEENMAARTTQAACGQDFVGAAPVVFVWSCVPYRCEWRYPLEATKLILLDAGHVCQNLYLACEALGLGTCAIGAYMQSAMDELLRLDGEEEFVVYLAPVGRG